MNLSFITINRFVEEKAASDEEYRRVLQQRGKVLLSHGRALPDEALLAKLRTFRLGLGKAEFLAQARRFFSAQEMAQAVYDSEGGRLKGNDEDWIWVAFTCLWERWLTDRPSLEMIDDQMQNGYKALARRDTTGACRLWLAAWRGIWNIIEALQIRSVAEFGARFPLTQSLFNWLQDLDMQLHNAGLEDRSFWQERIVFLETLLGWLRLGNGVESHCKNSLAETYFALSMPEKGEQLYRRWLHEEPEWGWGWIGWSDCYFLFAEEGAKDAVRAEQILQQGLAVRGVTDRQDLLDRLATLYEETGRAADAQAFRVDSKSPGQATVTGTAKAEGRRLPAEAPSGFQESGEPPPAVERLMAIVGRPGPRSVDRKTRVGRNDTCPCGSGKKFKRCCGRQMT